MSLKQKIQNFFFNIKTNNDYQLGIMAGILILGAAIVWIGVLYSGSHKIENDAINDNTNQVSKKKNNTKKQQLVARRIDGVLVPDNESNNHPIAVMIENLANEGVRPQYGLASAQVVYEAIVESGITRFMAVFAGSEELKQIGPVRSARPTYLEFSSEYDAYYVHAGGSPEALQAIDGLGIKDCSALYGDSRFFWRDSVLQAPHNLFTSGELLRYALRDKNFENDSPQYSSWKFKDENPDDLKDIEDGKYVNINFSSPEYAVEWKFDKASNLYQRYNGGSEHKDALSDSIITAKNIIIQIVPEAIPAGDDGRVNFDVNGEGSAYIFRDGVKIDGRWKKNSRVERTEFIDSDGNEIPLNRGNIWIEILPANQSFENN